MRIRNQAREALKLLSHRPNGVFNTEYTLDDIDNELSRREDVIQRVEKKTDKHHKLKRKYLEKAADSKNQRKLRYVSKAKENELHKSFYSELFDNMMAQQLFLTKLSLEAKRRQIGADPMEQFGFDVDIAGMDADAVTNALQKSSIQQEEIGDTIEQIQMEFDADSHSGLSLDLDELKQEAEMLEASDIESNSVDLGSEWDDAIDQQIDEELDRLDDDFNDPTGGQAESEG
jgi:hypothetical protein